VRYETKLSPFSEQLIPRALQIAPHAMCAHKARKLNNAAMSRGAKAKRFRLAGRGASCQMRNWTEISNNEYVMCTYRHTHPRMYTRFAKQCAPARRADRAARYGVKSESRIEFSEIEFRQFGRYFHSSFRTIQKGRGNTMHSTFRDCR